MDLLSIRELKGRVGANSEALRVHAQLESAQEKTSRGGKPYYELKFCDAEDSLVLRAWNDSPEFHSASSYRAGSFFEFRPSGGTTPTSIRSTPATGKFSARDPDIDALLAGPTNCAPSRTPTFNSSRDHRRHHRSAAAGAWAALSPDLRCAMRRTGAARDYHHARRGGLVEHVAQMMRSAVQICVAYPKLNRDLLVAGVLFHDVGKLWENAYASPGFHHALPRGRANCSATSRWVRNWSTGSGATCSTAIRQAANSG